LHDFHLMEKLIYTVFFFIRMKLITRFLSNLRRFYFRVQGMKIGVNTHIPKIFITWPHQVKIGSNCRLERNIIFNFDSIYQPGANIIIGNYNFIGNGVECNIQARLTVGNSCLIASGVKFIDHDHGTKKSAYIKNQHSKKQEIKVGNDVWIGANAIILKGTIIEDGAIIAAGSVVKGHINSMEIWAGVPAKKIKERL
jgi:acetyltransferase-like isoleucine patch superfamily enzyme